MKEFIINTGGRHTYAEDFKCIQDSALSIVSLFDSCKPFIISGVEVSGTKQAANLSPGYVYLAGRVRYYAGTTSPINLNAPYYLVEKNTNENVEYSEGVAKVGRIDYGVGGQTTKVPVSIQITHTYAPRINDEFFAKYCIVKKSPTDKQSVDNDLDVNGDLAVSGTTNVTGVVVRKKLPNNDIVSQSISIDATGNVVVGHIINDQQKTKLEYLASGGVRYSVDGVVVLTINNNGITAPSISTDLIRSGSITIFGNEIYNHRDDSDDAEIGVNKSGYNNTSSRFRNLIVYDGKTNPIICVSGKNKAAYMYGVFQSENTNSIPIRIKHTTQSRTSDLYQKYFAWSDDTDTDFAFFGFKSTTNKDMSIENTIGDVVLDAAGIISCKKNIKENGVLLSDKYADKKTTDDALSNKVNKSGSKQLSDENFSLSHKNKLDGIKTGTIAADDTGYVTGGDVHVVSGAKMSKKANLSDLENKSLARTNLGVQSTQDSDQKYLHASNDLSDLSDPVIARMNLDVDQKGTSYPKNETYSKMELYTSSDVDEKFQRKLSDSGWINIKDGLHIRQIGSMVSIQGRVSIVGAGAEWFKIPNEIGAPTHTIGGYIATDFSSNQNNRGLSWRCNGGNRVVSMIKQYGADNEVVISITYFTT
ncbi:MAG: hypothetical protein ACRDD8_06040 [Bacteroidales bacterium]